MLSCPLPEHEATLRGKEVGIKNEQADSDCIEISDDLHSPGNLFHLSIRRLLLEISDALDMIHFL